MADLVAFLEARITEDEAKIQAIARERIRVETAPIFSGSAILANLQQIDLFVSPSRWASECKAKRALIADIQTDEHYADYEGLGDCMIIHEGSTAECSCGTAERIQRRLAILAQPYADHPDFDPEWTTT